MSALTYRLQDSKANPKIVPPCLRTPCWKGLCAESEEKREPASDIEAAVVDSLKVLDPERPTREADLNRQARLVGSVENDPLPIRAFGEGLYLRQDALCGNP